MLKILSIATFLFLVGSCASVKQDKNIVDGVYEVSCGICKLEMTGDDCALAIRIDGKEYYIEGEGSGIDEHGDAHANDGLCQTIRKAQVKGKIKGGVFMAESVKILPE